MKPRHALEGCRIIFIGSPTAGKRKGIITDILHMEEAAKDGVYPEMVVLWDTDEVEYFDEKGKRTFICDSGVSVLPLSVLYLPEYAVIAPGDRPAHLQIRKNK